MLMASDGGQNKLVNGTISIVFLKDPTDPQWKNDAGDEALPQDPERSTRPARTPTTRCYVYGMAAAWTAVEALKRAGQGPHARVARQGARHVHRGREPVPAARHRRQDGGQGSLPDRADAAAALAGRRVEVVRRPLGLPRVLARLWPRGRLAGSDRSSMLRSSGARRPPGDNTVTDGTPRLRDPQRVPRRPHGRGAVAAPRARSSRTRRRSSSR